MPLEIFTKLNRVYREYKMFVAEDSSKGEPGEFQTSYTANRFVLDGNRAEIDLQEDVSMLQANNSYYMIINEFALYFEQLDGEWLISEIDCWSEPGYAEFKNKEFDEEAYLAKGKQAYLGATGR